MKSPPELSLNGKLGEKRQDPELFLLLQKRLGTARLAASQRVEQENKTLDKEREALGFLQAFPVLKLYFMLCSSCWVSVI